jgi:hypothetical protein
LGQHLSRVDIPDSARSEDDNLLAIIDLDQAFESGVMLKENT